MLTQQGLRGLWIVELSWWAQQCTARRRLEYYSSCSCASCPHVSDAACFARQPEQFDKSGGEMAVLWCYMLSIGCSLSPLHPNPRCGIPKNSTAVGSYITIKGSLFVSYLPSQVIILHVLECLGMFAIHMYHRIIHVSFCNVFAMVSTQSSSPAIAPAAHPGTRALASVPEHPRFSKDFPKPAVGIHWRINRTTNHYLFSANIQWDRCRRTLGHGSSWYFYVLSLSILWGKPP